MINTDNSSSQNIHQKGVGVGDNNNDATHDDNNYGNNIFQVNNWIVGTETCLMKSVTLFGS